MKSNKNNLFNVREKIILLGKNYQQNLIKILDIYSDTIFILSCKIVNLQSKILLKNINQIRCN